MRLLGNKYQRALFNSLTKKCTITGLYLIPSNGWCSKFRFPEEPPRCVTFAFAQSLRYCWWTVSSLHKRRPVLISRHFEVITQGWNAINDFPLLLSHWQRSWPALSSHKDCQDTANESSWPGRGEQPWQPTHFQSEPKRVLELSYSSSSW